ncbi:MAG TPA: DUF262 domain-containing protein [Solirubrobacterales bacterium]
MELTARFQRREVWKTPARSFFIDTLLRGYPVPPIYIRITQNEKKTKTVREVIDGQQRLRALLDFVDGKYELTNAVSEPWRGCSFADLSPAHQSTIKEYPLIFEVLHGISDQRVLEIFARLNTYSIPLNKQELRNGTYFGPFKQTSYGLAHEHIEFWRLNRIFTDARIARMLEVEFTSELLILAADGLQDKKTSINRFYAEFDSVFPDQSRHEERFRSVIDDIAETFGDNLSESEFRRPPLFYSLFAAVHHIRYGVPGLKPLVKKRRLTKKDMRALRASVGKLSDIVVLAKDEEAVPRKYERFVSASLRQTDNIQPRRTRTRTILQVALDL